MAVATDVRWEGFSHQELYEMAHGGAGPEAGFTVARQLRASTAELLGVDAELKGVLDSLGTVWTGEAAATAGAGYTPLGRWVADADVALSNARFAHEEHGHAVATVRETMPLPPQPRTEVGPLLADVAAQESAEQVARQRAIDVMRNYGDALPARRDLLMAAGEPPVVTVAGAPQGGGAGAGGARSGGVISARSSVPPFAAGSAPGADGGLVATAPASNTATLGAAPGEALAGTRSADPGMRGTTGGPVALADAAQGGGAGGGGAGGTGGAGAGVAGAGVAGGPYGGTVSPSGGGSATGRGGTVSGLPYQGGGTTSRLPPVGSGLAGSGSAQYLPGANLPGTSGVRPGTEAPGPWSERASGAAPWGAGSTAGGSGSGRGAVGGVANERTGAGRGAGYAGSVPDPGRSGSYPGTTDPLGRAGSESAGARGGRGAGSGQLIPPMMGAGGGSGGPGTRRRPGYLVDDSGVFDVDHLPFTAPVIGEE